MSRWNWRTCPIAIRPSRITSAGAACEQLGEAEWKRMVLDAAELLRAAVAAEYVVLGGGNARLFADLPPRLRRGHNDRAFEGGFRVWADGRPVPPGWRALSAHAASADGTQRARGPVPGRSGRAARFTLRLDDLVVDYSKNHVDAETMRLLAELARASGVEALAIGCSPATPINVTEGRAVLHIALRNRSGRPVLVDGRDVMPDVRAALDHMRTFSEARPLRCVDGLHGRARSPTS